jgi:predicted metal-dependent hydrolase
VSTKRQHIEIRGLPVEIVRKDIKNLHLGVYPPDGRVRVAAPLRLTDEAIRLAVITRLAWVRRQQAGFERQERQSEREMVSGENHYVQGRRYRLSVVEKNVPRSVATRKSTILEMRIPPGTARQAREVALHQWYRQRLRARLPELIQKWEPIVGVRVAECKIKRMRTRWGSCNPRANRIWVNLGLAKKTDSCLEYILVHEMVHLLERHHNNRFRDYMNRFMPQWRLYRDELNRSPLAHESWGY